ncbi:MAG: hypothetical protein MZW92_31925 [Comamonadaceae bacterium]|nr:hypothetical protein [Comamonadaceae bacterium]
MEYPPDRSAHDLEQLDVHLRCHQRTGAIEPSWPTVEKATVRDERQAGWPWNHWTGRFSCKDGGDYVRREQRPDYPGPGIGWSAAYVEAVLDRRDALAAALDAAADLVALDAVDLSFP